MARREPIIVFYDGECGFCARWVRFFLSRDASGSVFFAPMRGVTYGRLIGDAKLPESIVVRRPTGEVMAWSGAVAYLLYRLGGFWRFCGLLIMAFPEPLRDTGYRFVAANRKRLMGQPGNCALPPPEKRGQLLE